MAASVLPSPAGAAQPVGLPADVAIEIDRVAAQGQALLSRERTVYAKIGNPRLGGVLAERGRARADAALASVVIGAISRRPDLAGAIVQRAETAAPQSGATVRAVVRAAYPGLFDGVGVRSEVVRQSWYNQANLAAYTPGAGTVRPAPATAAPTPALTAGGQQYWYDQPVLRRYQGGAGAAYQPPLSVAHPVAPAVDVRGQIAAAPPAPGRSSEAVSAPQLTPPETTRADVIWDPLEPVNVAFFSFNEVVDTFALRPVAWIYSFTPDPIKRTVINMFDNLDNPVILINDLLQADFGDAATAAGRFAVNSTLGILGMFDVADDWLGWPAHHADFGQTLHAYGIGAGPYLVLPVLGPSNLRDSVGRLADFLVNPVRHVLPGDVYTGITVANAVATREQLLQPLDVLRSGSLDYYVSLRSAYYQNRVFELRKGRGRPPASEDVDRLFDELE